jgi:Arc/MetJ-type ribon-helix-helix transcriptional regulator
MNITLPAEQERWLEARISTGEFQSPEDAIRQLIAERMIGDDDMAWAKPLADEARSDIARGDAFSLEDAERDIDQTLRSLDR